MDHRVNVRRKGIFTDILIPAFFILRSMHYLQVFIVKAGFRKAEALLST